MKHSNYTEFDKKIFFWSTNLFLKINFMCENILNLSFWWVLLDTNVKTIALRNHYGRELLNENSNKFCRIHNAARNIILHIGTLASL